MKCLPSLALLLASALAGQATCLHVTCFGNKTVTCGSSWDFDLPTATNCTDPIGCGGTNGYKITVTSTVTNNINDKGDCQQIVRTWQVTNTCGESLSCAQAVTVRNTNPPVVHGATDRVVSACGSAAVSFSNVTATQNCCSAVSLVFSPPSGHVFPQGPTQVHWVATDCCGNSASNSFLVTVTPPTLQLTCSNKTVACTASWTFDPPTVQDGVSTTIVALTPITNGTCPQVISQPWQVTDACNNSSICTQVVTVVNTSVPVFQLVRDRGFTATFCTNVQVHYDVTATSPCCGSVSVVFSPTNDSFFAPNSSTTVTCVATDCCTNTSTTNFTITVTPPTLGLTCFQDRNVNCGDALTFDTPVVRPSCCPYTNVVFALAPVTNSTFPLSVTTIWMVTNACGESSGPCSQTVTVYSAPVFAGCDPVAIHCGDPVPTNAPTITDLCCANLTASLADLQTNNSSQGCEIDQTWQTVDCYNLTSTCVRAVTFLPSPPVVLCPTNKTVLGGFCSGGTGPESFAVLHSFPTPGAADGADPAPSLLLASDGKLYGTTESGGNGNNGTVFTLNQDGTGYRVLYRFGGQGDGAIPYAGLVEGSDGALYGTTAYGGSGTVFKLNKDGTGHSVLYNFGNSSGDGANPYAGLVIGQDGALYGTTPNGGDSGYGTVFKLDQSGGNYMVLKSFSPADGESPSRGGLLQASNGMLYGTTQLGGANGYGTVFTLRTNGAGFAVLKSFSGGDGANPVAGVVEGSGGALYGTTGGGGSNDAGTVFTLNQDGTGYQVLKHFDGGGSGWQPEAGLVRANDGTLYGTALRGGADTVGVIFKLNSDGTGFAVVKNCTGSEGDSPDSALVLGSDGALYGTASADGPDGQGTVFKLAPGAGWTFDLPTVVSSCCGTNVTITELCTSTNLLNCGNGANCSAGSLTGGVANITIYDGVNPLISVADDSPGDIYGPGDLNLSPGVVTVTTNVGVWYLSISTGRTKPALGCATNPVLDLNIQAYSSAAGSLRFVFSDRDFGPVSGTYSATANVQASVQATNGFATTFTYDVFSDPGDVVEATANQIASTGPLPSSFCPTVLSGQFSLPASSSLTQVLQLNSGGSNAISAHVSFSLPAPPATGPAVITRTWMITDCCGNSSICTQTVTVATAPPVVQCPADIVVAATNTNQVPVTFNVTVTGACSGSTLVCEPPSGSLFPLGTNRVTCYAVDGCGSQSAPCSFQVVVQPVLTITCGDSLYALSQDNAGSSILNTISTANNAATALFGVGSNFDALAYAAPDLGYGTDLFYAISNVNIDISVLCTISPGGGVVSRFTVPAGFEALAFAAPDLGYGSNLLYAIATDYSSDASTFYSISPGSAVVTARGGLGAELGFDGLAFSTENLGYGPNFFYSILHDVGQHWFLSSGGSSGPGSIQFGLGSFGYGLGRLAYRHSPQPANASSRMVPCGAPWSFVRPVIQDACCQDTNYTIQTLPLVTNGMCPQSISQTWIVSDTCGNTNQYTETLTVAAPMFAAGVQFSHSGSNNPAGEGWMASGGDANTFGTAQDDGGTPAWFDEDNSSNTFLFYVATPTAAQVAQGRTYGWDMSATVRLPDWAQPTDETSLAYSDGRYEWEMCFATTAGGDQYVVLANQNGPGLFQSSGPSYTNSGNNLYHTYELKYNPLTDTADLAVDGTVVLTGYNPFPANVIPTNHYRVGWGTGSTPNRGIAYYNAVDFTISNAPGLNIACATNKTVQCGSQWTFNPPTSTGGCCTNLTIIPLSTITNGSGCAQIISQAWLAMDCCSNSLICTQTVTVASSNAPSITITCPSNIVVKTCDTNVAVTWPNPMADSSCSSVTVTSTPPSGSVFLPRTTNTVICTATDACGNSNSCSFTVTVLRPLVGVPIISISGSTITTAWTDGILQQAPTVFGPWTDVPNAVAPVYHTSASTTQKFYRLRCTSP